jgi:hypothetical protein
VVNGNGRVCFKRGFSYANHSRSATHPTVSAVPGQGSGDDSCPAATGATRTTSTIPRRPRDQGQEQSRRVTASPKVVTGLIRGISYFVVTAVNSDCAESLDSSQFSLSDAPEPNVGIGPYGVRTFG